MSIKNLIACSPLRSTGLTQMIEPSYALDLGNDTTAPKQGLSLASVRGIRSQGLTRGSLAYNTLGGLVYPTASIGVVYSRRTHRYQIERLIAVAEHALRSISEPFSFALQLVSVIVLVVKYSSCHDMPNFKVPFVFPIPTSQRYFRGHDGRQITSLRVSSNGRFVASGEAGARPTVRVWDAATSVEV